MKTSISHLHTAKSKEEDTPRKVKTGKLVKFVLVAFMLAWITMMSSCAVMISPAGPMGYHHGGYGHVCFRPGCCGFGGWGGYHGDHGYHGGHGGHGDHGNHGGPH